MPTLYFLIGPTAVGKTASAIQWAMTHEAEILCADSPLVYRGMDIGTAKPTIEDQKKVCHHGIDLVGINERFSVGDYAAYAATIVKSIFEKDKNLLVVGGSGFYLKSFFKAPTDDIPISKEIAQEVDKVFASSGPEGLLKELKKHGGEELPGLDLKNPRRVMKALERVLGSGKTYQELRRIYEGKEPPYSNIKKKTIMLTRGNGDLHERIALRAKAMLDGGLVEEARRLDQQGLRQNPQASSVIGFRETLEYLDGHLTKSELLQRIITDTCQLARKQRTFFKQLPIDKVIQLKGDERVEIQGLFN